MSISLEQIAPDQWTKVLHDWYQMDDQQEVDHVLYEEDSKIIAVFVLRVGSEIKLVAAPETHLFATTSEKLSIENCITVTQRLIPHYDNQEDYDRTNIALNRMKNYCTANKQSNDIHLLMQEAQEVSKTLCRSITTHREDLLRDATNMYISHTLISYIFLVCSSFLNKNPLQGASIIQSDPTDSSKETYDFQSFDDDTDDLYK